MKKLEGFRLDGIVQKMKCPFLLLHGAGDEQIPLAIAEKCFAAVGSKDKTLKLYEGGYHDLLNDIDKETVMADILAWVNARMPAETAAAA